MAPNDIMLGETKTWMCRICLRSYRYKGALENHIKKEHPEAWDKTLEEFEQTEPPKAIIETIAVGEEAEVLEAKVHELAQEFPEIEFRKTFVPSELQEQFPFAEKWVLLNKKDKAKVEIAVGKVRPPAQLADILNFRIEGDLVVVVLVDGRKCQVDTMQS